MEKIYSIPFSNKAKQLDWFIMVELLERRYVVLLMFNPYAWIPPWLEFKNYSAYVRSSLDPFTLLIKKKKKKQRMLWFFIIYLEPKKKRKAQNKILDEWYVYRPSSKVVGLQECHQYWSLVKLHMNDKNMQFQEELSIATNTIDYRVIACYLWPPNFFFFFLKF